VRILRNIFFGRNFIGTAGIFNHTFLKFHRFYLLFRQMYG
jgi:hypothetical protein